tara:strand:+ start:7307 stop:8119 length:813 start_codon:yes stop_codon:yes gene_type:complete
MACAGFSPARNPGCVSFSGRTKFGVQTLGVHQRVNVATASSWNSEVVFVTGNAGKVARLELALGLFCGSREAGDELNKNEPDICHVSVTQIDLDIPEIQADTVAEVAMAKALDSFKELKKPLLVHDCGLCIASLNDWPGPYTKNVNDKLGTDGLLRLLEGETDRQARWDDTIVFVDESGHATTFQLGTSEEFSSEDDTSSDKQYSGEISKLPPQKYLRFEGPERALGRCFIPTSFGLTECLADVDETSYQNYRREAPSVWNEFAKWWGDK